ncbi:hypothetical protein [Rhizobium leguminosarum]|uniref:hypothetical protein n=1 Tax=Rhizobium leguminosarum TaxID=384 RepID=UPI00160F0375|nr:hypothetical protein [Rhizobium leguminosarum]MBB4342105.1 hypothetical protein [Rhizobium leguminosarum]MBB6294729.1 hypothetical protein [Rhizobium leguminosarum]
MTPQTIVLAGLKSHEVEKRLNVAYWSKGGDAQYHIDEARKAFADLASLLGYTVSKVDQVEDAA